MLIVEMLLTVFKRPLDVAVVHLCEMHIDVPLISYLVYTIRMVEVERLTVSPIRIIDTRIIFTDESIIEEDKMKTLR